MRIGRRLLLLTLGAALLTGAPARPAYAFVDFAAAVAAIGTWLATTISDGQALLDSVLLAIETELPIIEGQIELKTATNISMARSAATQQQYQRRAFWFTQQQLLGDPLQANCQARTSLSDSQVVEQAALTNNAIMAGDLGVMENQGGFLSGTTHMDPAARMQAEFQHQVCTYGNENDVSAAKTFGCDAQTAEQLKANPLRNANLMATTLTAQDGYDDPAQFRAAMDYCLAMVGNQPLDYADGRALLDNVEQWRQFLVSLSGKAARSVAADTCQYLVGRKLPLDFKFAVADPDFDRNGGFTDQEQQLAATNGATATTKQRTLADIDTSARKYLMDPSAGAAAYAEVDPVAKPVAGQLPQSSQHQLIKGQQLSREQDDLAMYVYRPLAGSTQRGQQTSDNQQMGLLLQSKGANLQMLWRQYASLERQLLFEAVSLARNVHAAPSYGDPGASSPTQ